MGMHEVQDLPKSAQAICLLPASPSQVLPQASCDLAHPQDPSLFNPAIPSLRNAKSYVHASCSPSKLTSDNTFLMHL